MQKKGLQIFGEKNYIWFEEEWISLLFSIQATIFFFLSVCEATSWGGRKWNMCHFHNISAKNSHICHNLRQISQGMLNIQQNSKT